MRGSFIGAAAALLLAAAAGGAEAAENDIDCKKTNLEFEAPGFTVECRDFSRASVNTGELNAATETYGMFAVSEAELTFLQVYSKAVLGGTRIYIRRRSLESELENSFSGSKFSGWGDEDDIGDFEVKHVSVTYGSGEPSDCIAFRKLGPRRYEGVSGLTAGFACAGDGRDRALDTVKRFVEQQ
jgi:hypothetical protein